MGRAYALGVPVPVTVEVVIMRRGPASPALFISGLKDAEAAESAELGLLAVLAHYDAPLSDFYARRYPLDCCPNVWGVVKDLSFKVNVLGASAEGGSIGAAVATAVASALTRIPVRPNNGMTGQVSAA